MHFLHAWASVRLKVRAVVKQLLQLLPLAVWQLILQLPWKSWAAKLDAGAAQVRNLHFHNPQRAQSRTCTTLSNGAKAAKPVRLIACAIDYHWNKKMHAGMLRNMHTSSQTALA